MLETRIKNIEQDQDILKSNYTEMIETKIRNIEQDQETLKTQSQHAHLESKIQLIEEDQESLRILYKVAEDKINKMDSKLKNNSHRSQNSQTA